jgi:antitoxin component YwqK of YwqJK toxin-antitoxin module
MRTRRVPKRAEEVIVETHEDGSRKAAEYYLGGQKIASLYWWPNGNLDMEFYYRNGLYHGPQRSWHDNGQLMWETSYVDGKEHGTARQWGRGGNLLGTYSMRYGTGIDLWWDEEEWLAEETSFVEGRPDGLERRWAREGLLWSERYWKDGQLHGISREWNCAGRLRRGYPQYHVNGVKVNKARYSKATLTDPTLIRFDVKDDQPRRRS